MTTEFFAHPKHATLPARQRWEAPAIILERSLQVSAQDGPPNPMGGPPSGLLGPLGTSGDTGNCGTF
jgi:hypothetical protein